jgi:signal transduction histidine kinase
MLAGIGVFMLIAFLFYRNNRNRKKANILLQKQKEELQSTLSELKSTQAQLIQSEKMASLGELTAGIAHEIQNPLNFVNNFSEVSNELIEELKIKNARLTDAFAQEKLQREKEEVNELLDDITQNLEKINFHGRRADAIVKGMLEHSKTSTGQKELTDMNKLADEYLRLSYHGLRAKDKTFNTEIKTDFDPSIGKVNVVPQEIGRVLLNLYNNAFYAVNAKKKQVADGYEPVVTVNSKKVDGKVVITVADNGTGIPQPIVDKIFQPFFTTKPTGQGTGLGLSLTYDIIKAHGGETKVETKEGEGSEFIIQLPVV